MKTVTEIKQVGKSEKYKLFLNDEFAFFVSLEAVYKNSIKKCNDYDEEFLKQVKAESDNFFAYTMALNLMATSIKTKKQLDEYLYKKGFDKDVRRLAIEKVESYGYINDKEYAERFVESAKKTKGINLIKQQLFAKGVSKDIVEQVLNGLSQENEIENLAKKFVKNKEKNDSTKQKLYRHLISKGFGYGDAMKTVSKFFQGDDYDWN